MSGAPDVFGIIHKGLRKAMFELCLALGRVDLAHPEQWDSARRSALEVVRCIDLHTAAENTLLLPMLEARAPLHFERMAHSHGDLDEVRAKVLEAVELDGEALYHEACAFTAQHLEHMREEEVVHLPVIHIHVSRDELLRYERQAAALAPPEDRMMLLGHMAGAVNGPELDKLLGRLAATFPAEAVEALRAAAGRR